MSLVLETMMSVPSVISPLTKRSPNGHAPLFYPNLNVRSMRGMVWGFLVSAHRNSPPESRRCWGMSPDILQCRLTSANVSQVGGIERSNTRRPTPLLAHFEQHMGHDMVRVWLKNPQRILKPGHWPGINEACGRQRWHTIHGIEKGNWDGVDLEVVLGLG